MKVLIDNGHGSTALGNCSPSFAYSHGGPMLVRQGDGSFKYFEWKAARYFAKELAKELAGRGYATELIVPEDYDVSLGERVKRVNRHKGEDCILISLHSDAAGDGSWSNARGWSAWTTPGTTKSDKLATCLYQEAMQNLDGIPVRTDYSDKDPDKEANFYILKNTFCPAVLVENLFHTNKADIEFLLSDEGKKKILMTLANGIDSYAKSFHLR